MLILIFYFTLFSFLYAICFSWKFGRKGSVFFGILSNFLSLLIVISSLNSFYLDPTQVLHFKLGVWFRSELLLVNWGFLFDSLSLIMCFIVFTISLLVQIYSYSYMYSDPSLPRFISYLSLFVFFMLMLVTSDNFIVLFLGWEGVGLCSYLLISFWNTRLPALKSALKAMLVNRVGDFFILIGVLFIFTELGSLNFLTLFPMIPYLSASKFCIFGLSFNLLNLICIFLLLGAFGKSAQLGLHVWLPDAMEGPTPVSALIHAATMVTAGIFLVIRCSPIFEYSASSLAFLTFMGAFTAIFAGCCGVVESDIKKIVAYSTCSQLGYMFFICGLSGYNIGLFHLFNHAFFKALLFLSAGSVIHSLSNEQNIMRMGALRKLIPFTFAMILIGLLSLTAFPFTAGFYSKEIILSVAFVNDNFAGNFAFFLGTLTSFLTAFYSYRLLYYVFLSENNINKQVLLNFHSENIVTLIPLTVLAFFSLFSGFFFKDLFLGLGSNFFDFSIFVLPENFSIDKAEFLPSYIKILPLIASLLGWGIINPYFFDLFIKYKLPNFYSLFRNEWFFNSFYNTSLNKLYSFGFSNIYLFMDSGLLQALGPRGLWKILYLMSFSVTRFHSGYLHRYLCIILVNSLFLFFFFEFFLA